MRTRRRVLNLLIATGFAMGSIYGCGLFKKNADDSDSSDEGGGPSAEQTTVVMSGTLNLTGDAGGASLTDPVYDLYCVTFNDPPAACKADIAADGTFSKECPGFAGYAFGCFIRKDKETLATLEFDEDTSIVAGAGALVFTVTYDAETGMASAKIDMDKSTAMSAEALAAIKALLGIAETSMDDLTGTWQLACEQGDDEMPCPPDFQEAMSLYLKQFNVGEQKKVAIWESENRRNVCVAGDDDSNPTFHLSIGAKKLSIDLSSKDAFIAAIDTALKNMDADVRTAILDAAANRARQEFSWCQQQTGDMNPFKAENCRLIVPEMETNTWFDHEKGVEVTETYPKWYGSWGEIPVAFSGTATAKTESCSFGEWEPGKVMCPHFAKDNGSGTGSYTIYVSGGKTVFLACMDPWSQAATDFERGVIQEPARGANLADAVARAAGGGTENNECDKVTYAVDNKERVKGEIDVIRRTVSELLAVDGEEKDRMCDRMTLPTDFSWSQCPNMQDGPMYDQEVPEVCWELQPLQMDLGIEVQNGVLVAGDATDWFPWHWGPMICPLVQQSLDDAMKAMPEDPHAIEVAKAAECRAVFLALPATDQVKKVQGMQAMWRPVSEEIICGGNTTIKTKLMTALSNSCMPQVFYDKMCDPQGCKITLRCPGSAAEGRCFDDAGTFAGRIPGRHAIMNLKMRLAGAFELSEMSVDRWQEWDAENNQPRECKMMNSTVINALSMDASHFKGIFTSSSMHGCEETQPAEGVMMLKDEGMEGKDEGRAMSFKASFTRQ